MLTIFLVLRKFGSPMPTKPTKTTRAITIPYEFRTIPRDGHSRKGKALGSDVSIGAFSLATAVVPDDGAGERIVCASAIRRAAIGRCSVSYFDRVALLRGALRNSKPGGQRI